VAFVSDLIPPNLGSSLFVFYRISYLVELVVGVVDDQLNPRPEGKKHTECKGTPKEESKERNQVTLVNRNPVSTPVLNQAVFLMPTNAAHCHITSVLVRFIEATYRCEPHGCT
jgi:hypothetical protein